MNKFQISSFIVSNAHWASWSKDKISLLDKVWHNFPSLLMIHHPSKTNIDIATDTDIDHDTDIDIATDVNIDTDIDIDIDTDIDELSPVKDWQLLQSESHLLQTRAHVSEQTKCPIWNYHNYSLSPTLTGMVMSQDLVEVSDLIDMWFFSDISPDPPIRGPWIRLKTKG